MEEIECTKICAKLVHRFFKFCAIIGEQGFTENVHFRISLREKLVLAYYNAVSRQKNFVIRFAH